MANQASSTNTRFGNAQPNSNLLDDANLAWRYNVRLLPDGLTAGQQPLKLFIQVRILIGHQSILPKLIHDFRI